jgi:hypothetical protein
LAADLQREFPKLGGYSSRNLKYMRAVCRCLTRPGDCAPAWCTNSMEAQLRPDGPSKGRQNAGFYIRKIVGQGWSRSVLVHHLDTELHKRAGKAPTNFALTLPSPQSDFAKELLKDPYVFKPAPLDESANERALESALIMRLKDFLIELGSRFRLGRQSISARGGQ